LRSLTIRERAIEAGLETLPSDLPLRELMIDNLDDRRSLRGIDRWPALVRVSIRGVPDKDDVQMLTTLPELRHLVVRQPKSAEDLARLTALQSLQRLDIDVKHEQEDAFHAAATRHLPNTICVRVNGRPV
jgi:hypothetical protein